jgi:hypothetical protein
MSTLRVEAGPDLERAIYAWTEQLPVTIGDKMIQGKHIISIEPDYHYYTGWYESYQPTTGDDWKQIERDCPKFDGYIEAYKQRVIQHIRTGHPELIGKGESIKLKLPDESPTDYGAKLLTTMKKKEQQ